MRVAAVQLNPQFGKIRENVDKAIRLMQQSPADLYVLPELFSTGYAFVDSSEAGSLAEQAGEGIAFGHLAEFAANSRAAVAYGFCEKSDAAIYNSSILIKENGEFEVYRKLHLFYREKETFTPGDLALRSLDWRETHLGIMICFDWIFPEVARCLSLQGADIICHPANLVLPYCQTAMVTRCLENRVFAITANRIGQENRYGLNYQFTGRSQITGPQGKILAQASPDKEEVIVADIDVKEARNKKVNEFNDLLRDRRPTFYRRLGE